MKNRILITVLIALALILGSCAASSEEGSKTSAQCAPEEVDAFLDELNQVIDQWTDTEARAYATSRIALSPVVGELQELRRQARSIYYPDCVRPLAGWTFIAMDQTIDAMLLFMRAEGSLSNYRISVIIESADFAWERAKSQLADARSQGVDTIRDASIQSISARKGAPIIPEGWKKVEVPAIGAQLGIPSEWGEPQTGVMVAGIDGALVRIDVTPDWVVPLREGSNASLDWLATNLSNEAHDYYYVLESQSLKWGNYDAYMVRSITRRPQFGLVDEVVALVVPKGGEMMVIRVFTVDNNSTLRGEALLVLDDILNTIDTR